VVLDLRGGLGGEEGNGIGGGGEVHHYPWKILRNDLRN
jgi:hypothetical protein